MLSHVLRNMTHQLSLTRCRGCDQQCELFEAVGSPLKGTVKHMGKRIFRVRQRFGLVSKHEQAMHEVEELEAMIRSQSQTAKAHRPKYEAKRKKLASVRDGLENKLRKANSPERRDELENKIERLDKQVQKASKRVQALDRRISRAAMAVDDIDILRMDIRLADGMDDIDYLETVHSLKSKITQDAMDEEMPGAKFDAVCEELNKLAEDTGVEQTGLLDDEFVEFEEPETTSAEASASASAEVEEKSA